MIMSQGDYRDSAGNFDPSSMESLQLAQAITNVHKKLLFAEKRDAVMHVENVESTYRHRKINLKDLGHGSQRHVAILLVPPADQVAKSRIVRLVLEVPSVAWDDASDVLRSMHATNIRDNAPEQFDETRAADFSQARYIPTRDVFGEATDKEGNTIKFLLSPTGLHAYELGEDIIPTAEHVAKDGHQYVVDTSFSTYEAQAKLVTEWFESTAELADLVDRYEPIIFDGNIGLSAS